jgi:hypothetical protein
MKNHHFLKKKLSALLLLIIFLSILFSYFTTFGLFTENSLPYNKEKPKMSWFWATLDLTNPGEVNNSMFTHYNFISVKGRIYNKIDHSNKSGVNVAIEVDDVVDMGYTDITDINGRFDINYQIDGNLDINSTHKVEVVVTDTEPGGPGSEIEYHHFYIIFVNATSDIVITSRDDPSFPKLPGEYYNFIGSLNYDNGQGVSSVSVNYYWLDGFTILDSGVLSTDGSGSLSPNSLQVPFTLASYITLKFNYSNPPLVGYSEENITDITVFTGASWDLTMPFPITEGVQFKLTGTVSSSTDPLIKIANRNVDIYYNNTFEGTVLTNAIGVFSYDITPMQNGTVPIRVELDSSLGKLFPLQQWIVVENAQATPGGGITLPPFMMFSLIFFPILIGIVIYGYRYYRKQEEGSRVVKIPLESKILNLKILKDSGRLEESLSYLFNAIYMDLVNAKYNRTRKENETIRDFAIISVKELKLTPSSIYPFIQQVEEIIYGKPYKVTEEAFYKTCELFSPIYFQLTGHNFVLNI